MNDQVHLFYLMTDLHEERDILTIELCRDGLNEEQLDFINTELISLNTQIQMTWDEIKNYNNRE